MRPYSVHVASDPEATTEELEACAEAHPVEVLHNPVMDLLSLIDPGAWLHISLRAWHFYLLGATRETLSSLDFKLYRAKDEAALKRYASWIETQVDCPNIEDRRNRRMAEQSIRWMWTCAHGSGEQKYKEEAVLKAGYNAIMARFCTGFEVEGPESFDDEEIKASLPLRMAYLKMICGMADGADMWRVEKGPKTMMPNRRRRR